MKLGLFYEHQCPQPWDDGAERKLLKESLAQVELAVGFEYAPGLGTLPAILNVAQDWPAHYSRRKST